MSSGKQVWGPGKVANVSKVSHKDKSLLILSSLLISFHSVVTNLGS